MSKNNSGIAVAGLVLAIGAILIGGIFFVLHTFGSVGGVNGGGPVFNTPFFPKGAYVGGQKTLSSADQIVIGRGKNQGIWTNRTGRTVYITEADLMLDGAASSTINQFVGTTSTTTLPTNGLYITDSFTAGVASAWSQFINGTTSTSTPAGVVADNGATHLSGYPSGIAVADGKSLLLEISSFCKADGACNTATSTNRGWTNAVLNFSYNIGLPL